MIKDSAVSSHCVQLSAAHPVLLWADAGAPCLQAETLAERLQLPLIRGKPAHQTLVLFLDADGLALGLSDMPCRHMLRADFSRILPRIQPQRLKSELLVRAAKIRKRRSTTLLAVDATAGLGEDAFLLAAAGFEVLLFEYNPFIAVLLEDALRKAQMLPELATICARMQLQCGDSIQLLQGLHSPPDLVYLDPMFPARHKSAKVKKKLQLLQMVEQPCTDEIALLQAALAAQPQKLVIKRPLKGAPFAGLKPSYSITGKAIRFDCLQVRS
ncbi:MAG: class I SAM-dependent methyltransferase [Desulfobulbaceae bacterium]|nr:class I SAM-dependent methyltransferase [Desulfobulbaceae bacterium]